MIEDFKIYCNYQINENRFLQILSKGITFKTVYYTLTQKKHCSKNIFEQNLHYNLYDENFLKLNEKKLIGLGVIKKLENNT